MLIVISDNPCSSGSQILFIRTQGFVMYCKQPETKTEVSLINVFVIHMIVAHPNISVLS